MRRVYPYLALCGFMVMLGFSYEYHLPRLKTWLLVQIEEQSARYLPMRVLPGNARLHLFPPGLSLDNIRILPKPELAQSLRSASLEELRIDLHLVQLLSGRLRIEDVTLFRPKVVANIPSTGKKTKIPPIEQILQFDQALGIAIERITVLRADVDVSVEKPALMIEARDFSAMLMKGRGALALQVVGPRLSIEGTSLETVREKRVSFSTRGGLRLTAEEFQISDLHVKRGKSIVRLNGQMDGDITKLTLENFKRPVDVEFQSLLDIEDLTQWAQETFPKLPKIKASGHLRTDLRLTQKNRGSVEVSGSVAGQELNVDGFRIGKADIGGRYHNNLIEFNKFHLENPAGPVDISGGELRLGEGFPFKGELSTTGLSLEEVLTSVRVAHVPVALQFKAKVPCSGMIKPAFAIKCSGGNVEARDLHVWSDRARSKPIVATQSTLTATGDLTVNKQEVTYKASVKSPSGVGESSGTINYDTGFRINYKANHFDFHEVGRLANLSLEGVADIVGTTEGDASQATFTMNVNGQKVWFQDYQLGNLSTLVSYKSGLLSFNDAHGQMGQSQYNGAVHFDFHTDQLDVKATAPLLDAVDLTNALSRKAKLPVTITGVGNAQIQVHGPPQFNALTYNLKSFLAHGAIAGEVYDKAIFNIRAERGEVRTEQVSISKGHGIAIMQGAGHPDGNIDVRIAGNGFRLEDSETVANLGSDITGLVGFDMHLRGYVLLPDTTLQGTITEAYIADTAVNPSHFKLRFSKRTMEGDLQLFGQTIQANFIYPWDNDAPFRLNLRSQDFDFVPIVSSVANNPNHGDYQSALTSQIDLSSPHGGFWNSTGSVKISHLQVRRGSLALSSREPTTIRFREGQVDIDHLNLEGNDAFLKIASKHPARKKLDVTVEGKTDLALLQIFTPFLSDLRGAATLTCQVHGDHEGIEILGSAFIEKGLAKIKQFPHAFTKIKSDILFNQRKVIFSSLAGELAGGTFSGEGDLELKGYKNFPVRLTLHLAGAELNVPDGVRSRGEADLQIVGSWFPYLLRGTYSIQSGVMTTEFSKSSSAPGTLRQSHYLPRFIVQDVFSPLAFQIDVDIGSGFMLRNSQADTPLSGNLTITGTTSNPNLKGVVSPLKGGKVLAQGNEFEISAGSVRFTEGKLYDPALYLTASARVQGYDINLLVQGSAQKPVIKFTSQPPLTEQEIISLLALGILPTSAQPDMARNEGKESAQSATKIGTALLGDSSIKKEIKNKTGLEVDISSANPNKNPTFAPVDDTVSEPKITVSRQWTPKFGASASRTVGDIQLSDVKFKYQLNRSLSVIGRWETREVDAAAIQTSQTTQNPGGIDSSSLFGLDLEYKLEFK